jgi:predicted nuclease of predicted toxin-antitoxin system
MRILVDMNLTPRWVEYLNGVGHETCHWSSIGPASAKDREICEYARTNGFVLLTNDLDFPQILAHTRDTGPSVVLLRGEPLTPEFRGRALVETLAECQREIAQGAVVSLDWSGHPRARVLPLR